MAEALPELCADLAAEHTALDEVVAQLDEAGWDRSTPAEGWAVRDQISHLWFFDEQARLAATDPEAFAAGLERALADLDAFVAGPLELGRARSGPELLDGWRSERSRLLDALEALDPSARVPWYGPAMSARSFVTARLMETWAHGQDVVDALGADREPTDRLRHVAHIGVRARPFSYTVRDRPLPEEEVRVELDGPGGERWTWGPAAVPDRVSGSALDFCLVVTQRRHLDDTGLTVEGPAATEWMGIAQAFAGPPGPGRSPGQFA